MKKWIIVTATALILCGCAGKKPPKPHGTPFPINHTVSGGV